MPSAQLLAIVPPLVDGGASATNPTPNLCNASAALSIGAIQTVAAGSSPRPMSGTPSITFSFSGTAGRSTSGVAYGAPGFSLLSVTGGAQSGAYNPVNDLGLLPYGGLVGNNELLNGPPSSLQIPLATLGIPTVLASATSWQSPAIYNFGLRHVTFALTSSAAVIVNLTRYVDRQGIASLGAVTATATAATAMALDNHDDAGFQTFSIGATNTSGSTATLSSFALLLSAT